MRTITSPASRLAAIRRSGLAAALLLTLAGCDSLPGALDPTTRGTGAAPTTMTVRNWQTAHLTQVIVNPAGSSGCTVDGATPNHGKVVALDLAQSTSTTFSVAPYCYFVMVRWQGMPGFAAFRVDLPKGYGFQPVGTFGPTFPTTANALDATLTITNTAAGNSSAITRVYIDACSPQGVINPGPGGGLTSIEAVTIPYGSSWSRQVPTACHLVTVLFANGRHGIFQFTVSSTTHRHTLDAHPE